MIHVACRVGIVPGVKTPVYEDYNLHNEFSGQARSGDVPSLMQFRGALWVFWKASVTNRPGSILYTSTDDGTVWEPPKDLGLKTTHAPNVCHYRDHTYVVYLSQNNEIMLSSSLDGQDEAVPAKYFRYAQGLHPSCLVLMARKSSQHYGSVYPRFDR